MQQHLATVIGTRNNTLLRDEGVDMNAYFITYCYDKALLLYH